MTDRHRNRTTSAANLALTLVSVRLPPQTADKLTAAAEAAGLPKRQFVKEAIDRYADSLLQRTAYKPPSPSGEDWGDQQRPLGYRADPPEHRSPPLSERELLQLETRRRHASTGRRPGPG